MLLLFSVLLSPSAQNLRGRGEEERRCAEQGSSRSRCGERQEGAGTRCVHPPMASGCACCAGSATADATSLPISMCLTLLGCEALRLRSFCLSWDRFFCARPLRHTSSAPDGTVLLWRVLCLHRQLCCEPHESTNYCESFSLPAPHTVSAGVARGRPAADARVSRPSGSASVPFARLLGHFLCPKFLQAAGRAVLPPTAAREHLCVTLTSLPEAFRRRRQASLTAHERFVTSRARALLQR